MPLFEFRPRVERQDPFKVKLSSGRTIYVKSDHDRRVLEVAAGATRAAQDAADQSQQQDLSGRTTVSAR